MFSDSLPEMRDQVSVSLEPAKTLEEQILEELESIRMCFPKDESIVDAINLSKDTIKRIFEDERTRESAIS